MKGLFSLFVFLVFSVGVKSQTFTNSRLLHYGVREGLSFGIVNSISQDGRGFMWFATTDGLNRFDSNTFKVFKNEKDNKSSLSSNYVQAIFTDKSGTLWVSSRDGLNKYDPRTSSFIHYRLGTGNDISCITQSRDGNLWLGTNNGFCHFNIITKKFRAYNQDNLKGLPSSSILSLYQDSKGILWVGTLGAGIAAFHTRGNLVSEQLKLPGAAGRRVNCIYEDSRKNVWIGTSAGLAVYNGRLKSFNVLNAASYGLKSNIFLSLTEDPRGRLLVGMQEIGLFHLTVSNNENERTSYAFERVQGEDGKPLTTRSVQALFRDKDRNIWVGTRGVGIFMISSLNEKFRKFQLTKADDEHVRFYGMCDDEQGNLWLGTDGDGIYKSAVSGKVIKRYLANGTPGSLTDNAILSAYRDSRNRLWFGTYAGGLLLYNKATDSFKSFTHQADNTVSLSANDVRVIYEDSKKRIWVGTNGGGLNLFDEKSGTFQCFNGKNSAISSDDIRAIADDGKGNLWLGTYGGGLNYFEVEKKRAQQVVTSQDQKTLTANNIVFALYLDKRGRLWIGSDGDGLVMYDTRSRKAKVITEKDGLANNTVTNILSDDETIFWLSTNKGISRVDSRTGKVNNYDVTDGLQEGVIFEHAAMHSKEGNFMIFGGTEGWNIFNPAAVKPNNSQPAVLITGLKLYGEQDEKSQTEEIRDITEDKVLELTPDQPVFSLNYVMLDYTFPSEGEFAYRLEGLDKDWVFVKNQQSATYRYLAPGTYTFKVKAANHDGIWTEQSASIKIKVLPPWYKTWWAYLVYCCTALGLVYSFIRYRTGQARLKYEIKTAHFEAEKEKELHRKKVDFFTSISHEFRSPLTLIINPLKEMLYEERGEISPVRLNGVYRNAKRLLSLVDQLLLFRKSENEINRLKVARLNLVNTCQEVSLCFTNQARIQRIDLQFNAESEDIELFADREKVEIVLFNLISNALKYTPEGGSVSINVSENGDNALISIKDTGVGIPEEVGEKLFEQFYQVSNHRLPSKGGFGIGLSLVKNFVLAHKGKVNYSSVNGDGTEFVVELRKGKSHFGSEVVFEETSETSVFLEELLEEENIPVDLPQEEFSEGERATDLYTEVKTILLVDDNAQIRQYMRQIFSSEFEVMEADNGLTGLEMIKQNMPDIVISDVMMQEMSGIELCSKAKGDPALNHIPIILLTASSSAEVKLKGIECGADDFISKPFEKEILMARVSGILRSRNNLQNYFYNKITLQPDSSKISNEYKEFLDKCIQIVEEHLSDDDFGIKKLSDLTGMSRSSLYLRIKSISGQSGISFIRSIRLRKAAEIFITTNCTISEVAYMVGLRDVKYFREQFNKLFGMNPSDYIRKYRNQFNLNHTIKKKKTS